MKYLTLIALFPLLTAPAFAEGGSIGGGTNIVINENELTDFASARAKIDGKQTLINPRNFKLLKEDKPYFETVKPALERMNKLYPSLGTVMDGAFEKPWLVVDTEFASRKDGERMVILQTDDAIYVNSNWLRKATPDQKRKAWLHEAVRNYANKVVKDLKKNVDRACTERENSPCLDLADHVTEELTPTIYNNLPSVSVAASMEKAEAEINRYASKRSAGMDNSPSQFQYLKTLPRSQVYDSLKKIGAGESFAKLCSSSGFAEGALNQHYTFVNSKEGEASQALEHTFQLGHHRVRLLDADDRKIMEFFLAAGAKNFFGNSPNLSLSNLRELCQELKGNRLLQEFIKDEGKAVDTVKAVDTLPDEDDAPKGEKAAD